MGSETPLIKLPIVNFSGEDLVPGTNNWVSVRNKACKALVEYGCFEAVYDDVPLKLRKSISGALEQLFELPLETKLRNINMKRPYHGYFGQNPLVSLYESLAINDAPVLEKVQDFTELMWPEGNENFCEIVHLFTSGIHELAKKVMRAVFENYGVEKYYESHIESITSLLRVMKYRVPLKNESKLGLNSHTDKGFITILHQNQINGLELQTKTGEWFSVIPSPNSFVVMIGDAFLAWSNGRLHSPRHRVTMDGDVTRYSTALFTFSKEIIQVPEELVDEDHPLMFKPFDNMGLIDFYVSEEGRRAESTVKAYCGV